MEVRISRVGFSSKVTTGFELQFVLIFVSLLSHINESSVKFFHVLLSIAFITVAQSQARILPSSVQCMTTGSMGSALEYSASFSLFPSMYMDDVLLSTF